MIDTERLLDDGSDEERSLLSAARQDRAPRALRAHVLASLGIASGVAVTASSASAGVLGIVKWLGAGLVAGTLVTSGATLLVNRGDDPHGAVARATSPLAVTAAADPPSQREESAKNPALLPDLVEAPSKKPGPAVPSPMLEPQSTPADARRLADEIASLDRARSALAAGNPQKALRELDRHAHEFPKGALGPEVEVLRIESLLRAGQRSRAASLARRFLELQGRGPHASRVRSLLAQAEPTSSSSAFPIRE